MKRTTARLALVLATLLAVPPMASRAAQPAAGGDSGSAAGVAWLPAASDAEVDAAFARARGERKPLLLYWGARWCPPCNQLEATLFNRQDFIERTRAFVDVHVDGDAPGAQKLGQRFRVVGYPTLVLFRPDGTELTRLPGEVDPGQVVGLLQQGLAGGRAVKELLADARAGRPLPANEWRALAFYSWDTDEQRLSPAAERAALLATLAAACPEREAESKTRLWLKALAASDEGQGVKADRALRGRIEALLRDPRAVRQQMDGLTGAAPEIVRNLGAPEAGGERPRLVALYDAALARLQADATLSRADRLGALYARMALARLDASERDDEEAAPAPALPAPLLAELRDQVARDDREITSGYERQAVIPFAAYMLRKAGLLDASDALLEANLAKSHSPYYLMSSLAGNAKARGDKRKALEWSERAWEASVGPATRLQWGASHVAALVEMAPEDAARIERAASRVFAEAAAQPNAFYERNARSLQRIGEKLQSWNAGGAHADSLARLQRQLDADCARLDEKDGQRATCDALLSPARKSAT